MATRLSSRERDELVLDSVRRLGLGVRELLRHALGGVDPNNILQRLGARKLVRSVPRGLPQNRAYYLPAGEAALGAQALHQRLALAWHVQMDSSKERIPLTRAELTSLLGLQAPPGLHLLQTGHADRPRVMQVYAPETTDVASGIVRNIERARSFPKVADAIASKDFGFSVLLPWNSALVAKLRQALTGAPVPGLLALAKHNVHAKAVHLEVARVATPETLSLALGETASQKSSATP